jgi:hypothetical protein
MEYWVITSLAFIVDSTPYFVQSGYQLLLNNLQIGINCSVYNLLYTPF